MQFSQFDISVLKYLVNVTLLFFFFGLSSRLINVAVNYVAISEALGVSPSVLAAGVAADNVITALYFVALFALASRTPPEPLTSTDGIWFLLVSISCKSFSENLHPCVAQSLIISYLAVAPLTTYNPCYLYLFKIGSF